MRELRYTLHAEGTSDRAFLPLLTWLLQTHGVKCPIQEEWADLQRLPNPPQRLPERIRWALELYPCDLLFVHRDADKLPRSKRLDEIHEAVAQLEAVPPIICVVPVRMLEAWLLFDEKALRRAAGNPNGQQPLALPRHHELEQLPDPKSMLYELLREASGLRGRRLQQFKPRGYRPRIAQLIKDFSPLRGLSAFDALEADVKRMIAEQGWRE